MTVRRQSSEDFEASQEQLLGHILEILNTGQEKYSYVEIEANHDTGQINTRIRPNSWLLLSTRLRIQVKGSNAASTIIVSTCSQWWIFGDILNYYHSYIRDILSTLRSKVEGNA